MERSTLDIWVGAFVVAGFAALVILAFKVGNLGTYNVAETYTVHAHFSNIGGLKPTASIRSAGVLVGRVGDIRLDTENYEAEVTMQIDKRYQFPTDTLASILTSGLLGEQYVGLRPGAEEDMLKDGGAIKNSSSAVVLEEMIGKMISSKAEAP